MVSILTTVKVYLNNPFHPRNPRLKNPSQLLLTTYHYFTLSPLNSPLSTLNSQLSTTYPSSTASI